MILFFSDILSLFVEEARVLLKQLSDDEALNEVDISYCLPSQNNGITDEDSGPKDSVGVDKLSVKLLRTSDTITLRRVNYGKQYLGDIDLSSDGEELEPPPSNCENKGEINGNRNKDIPTQKKDNISWNAPKPDF